MKRVLDKFHKYTFYAYLLTPDPNKQTSLHLKLFKIKNQAGVKFLHANILC